MIIRCSFHWYFHLQSGYREGIIAGKESALQEGFDAGFADVGVPLGRELGSMRGAISVITSFLSSNGQGESAALASAREISSFLASVRFSDIVPIDHEAEQHAREHLDADDPIGQNEELLQKREVEGLEDMLQKLTTSPENSSSQNRPTREDVVRMKERILALNAHLGFQQYTLV